MWELYDKNKVYYSEQGEELTWDVLKNIYPQSMFEDIVILADGITYHEYKTMMIALSEYGIQDSGDIKTNISILNGEYNLKKTESTPIERIASALEYLCVVLQKG